DAGVIFKLTPGGRERVLYNFCSEQNCTDGRCPVARLLADSSGNLYATTSTGGKGGGRVLKLAPDGIATVLGIFCLQGFCTGQGTAPLGGLVADEAGCLFGTTSAGGAGGAGVVFRLDPNLFEARRANARSRSKLAGCTH